MGGGMAVDDEREEGTREEERQMDNHDITQDCALVCVRACISTFLCPSFACQFSSNRCIIKAFT